MSGTLRSTLDVFDEYEDAEIVRLLLCHTIADADPWWQFEALRRVHLIPSEDSPVDDPETLNANIFRNLDFAVTEEGENFSTGYDMRLPFLLRLTNGMQGETIVMHGACHPKAIQSTCYG